ncbi:MAG: glycosyltransferase family 39 protein [Planctomycetota bacterium]
MASHGSDADAAGPASRLERGLTAFLALVVLASLFWSVHPWYDATNDGSMYIATARALAAGEGYTYNETPFLIRPPGFSCLLAPLLAWRGTDFFALNLFVSLWGALGVFLFQRWARARLGAVLATAAALLLWFNPGYQRLCTQVMSDVPGWTLLVASFLLARSVARRPTLARFAALGLVLGLASLVRSGNLLFLPALVAAFAARELFGGATRLGVRACAGHVLALVCGCALVLAPWSLRNRLVAAPPPADQTLLYSYGSGMWHADMGDPNSPRVTWSEVLGRLPKQGKKLLWTLGERLGEGAGSARTPWIAGAMLLALVVALLRHRAAEEVLAFATLAVVAFYFGYAGRLLLPVFALAVVAVLELVRDGCGRAFGTRVGAGLALLLALAWLGLDFRPRAGWSEIEALHTAFARNAEQVKKNLAPDARLGAYRGWDHAVYLERDVFNLENAVRREGLALAVPALIEKYRLDTLLLTPLGLPESVAREERAFAAEVVRRHGGRELGLVRVR